MHILTLNAGSATLKAAWAEAEPDGRVELRARVERSAADAGSGSTEDLLEPCLAALEDLPRSLDAVAHRIVYGGERFVRPALLDPAAEQVLSALVSRAPLHLPPALAVIAAARRRFAGVPQIGVFDTAFHAGRAPESQLYALPAEVAEEIRRHGYHGIAHQSLVESLACAEQVEPGELYAVTLQLGSGCSACAVERGRSIETSMGFTPLEGLVMATRAGDVDPGALLFLLRAGHDADSLEQLLTRRSGLLGLAGSADVREVVAAEARGDARAALALRLFVRRIAMVAGAYFTLLGGRGALVFGGGIGAGSAAIRSRVAIALGAWNVALDPRRNASGERGRISADGSRPVYAFATDEERILAREAAHCLGSA